MGWRNDLPWHFCLTYWFLSSASGVLKGTLFLMRLNRLLSISCSGPTDNPNKKLVLSSAPRGCFPWWAQKSLLPSDCPGDCIDCSSDACQLTQQQSSQDGFRNTAHFFPHLICTQTHTSHIASECLNHHIKGQTWVLSQEDPWSGLSF